MNIDTKIKTEISIAAFVCGLAGLLIVLLHELGHYFARILMGHEVRLYHNQVIVVSRNPEYIEYDHLAVLAGPCVEATLSLIGCVGLIWIYKKQIKVGEYVWRVWFITMASSLAGRGLRALVMGHDSDEARVSASFGFPEIRLAMLSALYGSIVFIFLLRFHYKRGSILPMAVGGISGLIGVLTWAYILGPIILPRD